MTRLNLDLRPETADAGVLLAWSGGLDSTVLLYRLREWAAQTGAALHALHIDHRLRASSGEDVAFCRRIAAELGVSLWVETLKINAAGSTQQNARIQRYATLARVANRLGVGAVITAHHADDALETALLNLRRGTSTAGLSTSKNTGGPPIPAWPADISLERPFIGVFRSEILAYARERALKWHEDPSNATSAYQRNQLRHEVLPGLSENGRYSRGILRSLENLADENDALEAIAASTLRSAWLTPPDVESVALRSAPFHGLPAAIVTRALQLATRRLPAEVGLTRGHRDTLADAISQRATLRLDIRAGVIQVTPHMILLEVARGRGAPHLRQREAAAIPLQRPTSSLPNPSETPWFGSTFLWRELPSETVPSETTPSQDPTCFYDFGAGDTAPAATFIIRSPRPGDRVKIPGLNGHKSVTALLGEANIPDFLRWRWPCLVQKDNGNLVEWVCGVRHGEKRMSFDAQAPRSRLQWTVTRGSVFSQVIFPIIPKGSYEDGQN